MTLRLTRAQVREIDRRATADYRIPSLELMENAARAVADVAMEMLAGSEQRVLIVAGHGNNGGDGYAVARLLHQRGCDVTILMTDGTFTPNTMANMIQARSLKIPTRPATHSAVRRAKCDLIIDALLGTGLTTPPRAATAELIDAVNTTATPVLAIDLPSGLDCDTGEPLGPAVRATRTVTFVAQKAGFANPRSRQYTGEITVADIGVPRDLIPAVTA
jgi:NAD(P)H-hydrate epimerase